VIVVAISVVVADSVTIAIAVAHRRCHWPLPLRSPSTIAATVSIALRSAIAIAIAVTIALAIGHCRLHHRRPSQLPSPLAITVTVTIGHFRARIVFDQLKQRMLTLFYFVWTVGGALIKAG
jgi:hypothetical protein